MPIIFYNIFIDIYKWEFKMKSNDSTERTLGTDASGVREWKTNNIVNKLILNRASTWDESQSKDDEAGKRELHRQKKEWDVTRIGK